MRYKLTFVAGFTAGYVLGTKAGRKRYDTITDGVRRLIDSPAVQETAGVLQAQASGAFATARSTVTAKVGDKVSARFGGSSHDGHFFGDDLDGAADRLDPDGTPPYPHAGPDES